MVDPPRKPALIRPHTTPDASSDLIAEEFSSSESGTMLAHPDQCLVSSSSPTHLSSDHPDKDQDNDPGIKDWLKLLHLQPPLPTVSLAARQHY
ncbi:hypothetical protein PCASD_24588 [Puccinia coronata f. sp. avenae]|uniref:Uncharacterized protein n=1 Tax=Puccinia coronata f. sp. avenae TaxID=200324 RepID=A0A2N5S3Y9_9BASI|nr:hypothetical protein PCASD_24588 [Puccinia coronata f. sp. avenae]